MKPNEPRPKKGSKYLWLAIGGFALALLAALLVPIILVAFAFGESCGNDNALEFPSPNGHLKAVVFRRDCGATTSFSMNVSILPAAQSLPNKPGNVFVMDSDTPPSVHWIDDTHLLISNTLPGKIFEQLPTFGQVQITYKEGT